MGINHSKNLHSETENPGNLFNKDTLEIIRFRYDFAAPFTLGKKVLEIGCGAGLGLEYLGRSALSIVGGDLSDENINLCRKIHGDSLKIQKIDAHKIPFGSDAFDVVVAMAMFYYLDANVFLDEVKRILTHNGRLIFCTSNKDVAGFVAAPHTVRYYSIPELDKILKGKGFKPIFYGGFKASGGSVFINEIRGVAKNSFKAITTKLPFGEKAWKTVRAKAMGRLYPLPIKISLIPKSDQQLTLIDPCCKDRIHRIIYVVAEKCARDK